MRATSVVLVLALAAMVPAAAQAQDRKWIGEIGFGPSIALGQAGDNVGTGFAFQAGATYKMAPRYGFKIDTLVSHHDIKDDITAALGVGDGNAWIWHLSGNFVVSTNMEAKTSVYGLAGLGIYYRKVELTNPSAGFVTVCDPWIGICYPVLVPATQIVGSYSSTNFGMNFGGGVNFRVGHETAVFVETRYHYVWGDTPSQQVVVQPLTGGPTQTSGGNGNSQFFPIIFGVRF